MNARPRKELDLTTYEARFAARLKLLREKAELTPEEAAERLGVTPTTVYHWESLQRSPRIAEFPKIAAAYNLKKTKDLFPNE